MATLTRMTRFSPSERRNFWMGLLFAAPWIIGFLGFTLIPMASSLYYSFTRYDLLTPPRFIGPDHYINLFTADDDFRRVMYNTMWWVLISAPLGVISAFIMAVLLNTDIHGRSVFRAIYFFPAIVPSVVIAFVWAFLLNIQYGAVNAALKGFGLPVIPFLSSPDLIKPTLVLIHIWGQGAAMVIFLATLQDVPRSLYEAATLDGANAWRRLWHITIPMVSPVILFNTVMAIIGGFQTFLLPWLMTGGTGGPKRAAELYAMFLYRNAFSYLRMDKASALAWVLCVIIVVFTYALFRSSGRLVYYAGSDQSEG
jgi:multiple sugar transport system permease protein